MDWQREIFRCKSLEVIRMQVKVADRMYRMSRKEYQGVLKVASEQVPFGVYAIEKGNYAELRNDKCQSSTKLKELVRAFKTQGFRVLANGR